jgi:SAM-dependent methyltransferase
MTCPICESDSRHLEDAPAWGQWRKCLECELEFVDPLALPERPEELYEGAYGGERDENAMIDFRERVQQRKALMRDPTLWFWTPAFYEIIDWLKSRVRRGSTVLEVGSGLGFVLRTLEQEGFDAVGLDVARTVVELTRQDGFQVWHGTVDTVPSGWVSPDAVIAFFMLHHLEDPLAFLRTIRAQWPNAPLALAQYGPSNRDPIRSAPPRTLTRWNARSLRRAFVEAGYEPRVTDVRSTGAERQFLRPVRVALRRTLAIPSVHRLERRIERRLLPRLLTQFGQPEYVVVAFGEPVAQQVCVDALADARGATK